MTDWIGWIASLLLLATIASQVRTQWRSHSASGVSPVLFIGQLLASILFTVYSVLKDDPVFIAVNALMVLNALVGFCIDRRNRG